ncbi:MAG: type IV pilin protein [Methylomicrobium sp.]
MYNLKRNAGFTLIELMIVVAIVGILAGIAYPSYTEYVKKGRRADAKSALLQVQLAEEKYRTNNIGYGTLAQIGVSASSPDQYYTIAVSSATATGYAATATPAGIQTGDSCGTFAVNEGGKTTSTSVQTTTAKVQECWGK